jgi:hypothetical protein
MYLEERLLRRKNIGMNNLARRVRTLIGHQQVEVGLKCLRSLLRLSSDPLSLLIHDDGTLTKEDHEVLTSKLPSSTIISRDEADSLILPLLTRYPKCLEYRRNHPLALKLIDMALLETNELAYCDSDVFFLRPYTRLFVWPEGKTSAVFMQDRQEAYSLRPWHLHPIGKMRMPRRVNSGLILFRTPAYDLDFIEWILGYQPLDGVFKKRQHWIEQTCWAALGWRVGCSVWSSRQLIIASPEMSGLSKETVGIHFVAACRSKLNDFSEQPDKGHTNGAAVIIHSAPSRTSSPLRLLIQDVIKKL